MQATCSPSGALKSMTVITTTITTRDHVDSSVTAASASKTGTSQCDKDLHHHPQTIDYLPMRLSCFSAWSAAYPRVQPHLKYGAGRIVGLACETSLAQLPLAVARTTANSAMLDPSSLNQAEGLSTGRPSLSLSALPGLPGYLQPVPGLFTILWPLLIADECPSRLLQ
ncbi:predicted protein [Pyrenophora tritici-repentis Pt-1C-BFP]|uniref:Uncharacterized protein n=1 Tax=Pyrenophora tritici-repentis (strain Pt-1C-BFP) TaxID=426418 RepID=B2W145_PYRTR|nr:uncharacterized protein PTRG_04180 [Pyrenophora tritici-repentis Pt-1C-BFP]EDU47018.1 predicted protein [Pyrenophora tritici-repentis Pt-1C-BFP]